MRSDHVAVSPASIMGIAGRFPANPVALALAIESEGVGAEEFRLPTRLLAQRNFLPGWTRQNYRTAIASALRLGLIERVGSTAPGRAGSLYRLCVENGLESGPAIKGAR